MLALRLFEQWEAQQSDSEVQAVLQEIVKSEPTRICEIIEADKKVRKKIIDILNSCERIAIAVMDGSADERTLRERLMPVLGVYFRELSPFIAHQRAKHLAPHFYLETERLLARWG